MAAPAYASSGATHAASGTSHAIAVPASVVAGDIIVSILFLDGASSAVSAPPTGFTDVPGSPVNPGTSHTLSVMWKRATGADSGTYTFTTNSTFVEGAAHRFTGAAGSGTPFDTPGGGDTGTAFSDVSQTSSSSVNMTTADVDRLVLHIATNWGGGTFTAPASFTKDWTATVDSVAYLSHHAQATAGNTGGLVSTCTASDKNRSLVAAMTPPASAPSLPPNVVMAPITGF